jgi:hypothetical protein
MIRLELEGAPDAPERGAELGCGGTVSPVSLVIPAISVLDIPLPITALAVSDGELVDTFDPSQ